MEPQFQKDKGRVVFRGDMVKEESGSYAVFTEQGSRASQTTAAKVMDVIYQGHQDGQDKPQTQYVHTPRSEWKMHHDCEKFGSQIVQIFGYVYQNEKWPISWSIMEDPGVPLERNLYGHFVAGVLWKRQFEKVLLDIR